MPDPILELREICKAFQLRKLLSIAWNLALRFGRIFDDPICLPEYLNNYGSFSREILFTFSFYISYENKKLLGCNDAEYRSLEEYKDTLVSL